MKIYPSLKLFRDLTTKLCREVRSWDEDITRGDALYVVARMFGHPDYESFRKESDLRQGCTSDGRVADAERSARYDQYVDVMSTLDFTREEAKELIGKIWAGDWWGIKDGAMLPRVRNVAPMLTVDGISPSAVKVRFKDETVPKAIAKQLRKFCSRHGIELVGKYALVAKLFGWDSYTELTAVIGRGVGSPSDWNLAPGELDLRAEEYLRVLREAGFTKEQAEHALTEVGTSGWWHIGMTRATLTVRQADHVRRITWERRPPARNDLAKPHQTPDLRINSSSASP
jgi:hypothetical protein